TTTFSFEASASYYNIKASKSATGGNSSHVYLHQGSNWNNRNFVIMLEASSYNSTPNSRFSFIKEEDLGNEDDYLPEVSTEDKPIWYQIQVLGSDTGRSGRMFTVQNGEVYGQPAVSSIEPEEIDPQLWRFELDGTEYVIINKATNQKLGVVYSTAKGGIGILNVSNNPTGKWKLNRMSEQYYQMESTVAAAGGGSSDVFAHQSNSANGVRNYVIMLVATNWGTSADSYFNFVRYEDPSVKISDDTNTTWYYITNTMEGYTNKCMTDVTALSENVKFSVEDIDKTSEYQQWKVLRNSADPLDKKVQFVNKATNNIIQTNSVPYGLFTYIQYTTTFSESNGWNLNYIGDKQYEISGEETDGVVRYLFAADESFTFPEVYVEGALNSAFSWEFVMVEGPGVGIDPIITEDNIKVYVEDKKIVVKGTDDYRVWNIQGIQLVKDIRLSNGVYIVRLPNRSVKVLVK
ncbi:hypothetical protein LJC52_05915, partial [Bacteroidales bacterium OttesenSCG-928-A17]|nr:hypothetical protein [Bacteroidales bacterium OttesenSCG-928-A17]